MDTSTSPLLEVSQLSVAYGGLVGLHDLSIQVSGGEIVVLLGANGAGKSSAINAIAGAVPARGGGVRLAGDDISGRPAWWIAQRGVVLVPEGREIIGPLSVEENLQMGSFADRNRRRNSEALMTQVFDLFPVLRERRHSLGGLLSGGEQQMLAFGRALMARPRVVLLDEPSMGLAPVMIDRVFESVVQIAALGIGVLMVEQNAGALDIASKCAVLELGHVVASGTPGELKSTTRLTEAFLGSNHDNAPAEEQK